LLSPTLVGSAWIQNMVSSHDMVDITIDRGAGRRFASGRTGHG
jgi:hypothetical protein